MELDQLINQEASPRLFKAIDVNNDGYISQSELIDVCLKFDKKAPVSQIEKIFELAAQSHFRSYSAHVEGLKYDQFFSLFCAMASHIKELGVKETGSGKSFMITLGLKPRSTKSINWLKKLLNDVWHTAVGLIRNRL